jgi:3-dehydroquinate dehydratase
MRDIRGDLQERAKLLEQKIDAAQAQFEGLIIKLKREQGSTVEDLKTQLEYVNRLIRVAAWQHNVRAAVTRAIAAVTEVEVSAVAAAGQFSHSQTEPRRLHLE